MKTLMFTAIFLLSFICGASAIEHGVIRGRILEEKSATPLPYATVALYKLPDSTLVTGCTTNEKGEFIIEQLHDGEYEVVIRHMGYSDARISNLTINSSSATQDLGTIIIHEADNTLGEVTIEATRLQAVEEIDKTVYNVNEGIARSSNSALDVLKYIPSMQVDFQNNVSLEGSSNILILVDGKQRDKDYLSQIDPGRIDKVEVITKPSVKYEADVTGVINIILKREKKHGFGGRINGEVPVGGSSFSNSNAGLDYGYNRLHVYATDYLHLEGFRTRELVERYMEGNEEPAFRQLGTGDFDMLFNRIDYGADYFLNQNNTLDFYGNYSSFDMTFAYDYDKYINDTDGNQDYMTSLSERQQNNKSTYYSVFYKHLFGKPGQELTLDLSYGNADDRGVNRYRDQYYDISIQPEGPEVSRYEEVVNYRDYGHVKLDYTQPLNEKYRLETGLKYYGQWMDNSLSAASDATNATFVYDENRYAVYSSVSANYTKFGWQAGLRLENSDIMIDGQIPAGYTCLLPNVNLQQKLGDKQSLKFTYRRSINRPASNDLNPFVTYFDSLNISTGNPELKPSFRNEFELAYATSPKTHYLSPRVFVNYNTDVFQRITRISDMGVAESYVDNVGKVVEYGVSLTASLKLTKWWNLNSFARVFKQQAYGVGQEDNRLTLATQGMSWGGNIGSNMNLPKGWRINMFAYYNAPSFSYHQEFRRDPIYVVSVEKDITKRARIGVDLVNAFKNEFIFSNTLFKTDDFSQEYKGVIDFDWLVLVGFSYNFNKGGEIRKNNRVKELEQTNNSAL